MGTELVKAVVEIVSELRLGFITGALLGFLAEVALWWSLKKMIRKLDELGFQGYENFIKRCVDDRLSEHGLDKQS